MKQVRAQRILVYRIGQLGDTIVALPAMWAIRKHFPTAYMALLSDRHPGTGYVLAPSVLPKEGLFDQYISYEANIKGTDPRKLLSVLPKLRQGRFDTLVYLAPRLRKRWQIWRDLTFFRLAGITQFIGHRSFESLPRPAPGDPLPYVEHEADYLLRGLAHSGIPIPPPGHGCMDLRLTERELAEAQEWLRAQIGVNPQGLLIGLGPGSKWPSKVWPQDRYVRLGQYLIEKFGAFPVVFGGVEDRELGNRLIAQWNRGANAAGELNVRQAAAALSFCRLYIGNDNGTMHLAAAVGTQCIAIFAAQDWPGRWYPYGGRHIVLRRTVPCEGCMLPKCIKQGMVCLKQIHVAEVMAACHAVLTEDIHLAEQPKGGASGSNSMKRAAIFLDRDGVINHDRPGFVKSWAEFEFLPGVLDALRLLAATPYAIVVITNQSAVGRGLLTLQTLDEIHARMLQVIRAAGGRVDAIYYCPHHPDAGCLCRKPRPGLLLQAARDLDLDLSRCWLIGDSPRDLRSAAAAGVQAILVRTGHGEAALCLITSSLPAIFVAADLREAVEHILGVLSCVY